MNQSSELTHIDDQGRAAMVDVGDKAVVRRTAIAEGIIHLDPATILLIQAKQIPKGEVLATARIAGIQAAKRTDELIPLCHSLPLDAVGIDFAIQADSIRITSYAKCSARTGVEMEALTAVSVAALTIYDMCKAVDKTMRIDNIRLIKKEKTEIQP